MKNRTHKQNGTAVTTAAQSTTQLAPAQPEIRPRVRQAIRYTACLSRRSEEKILNDALEYAFRGTLDRQQTVGNWLEQMPSGEGPVEVRVRLERADMAVVLGYMVNQNATLDAVIRHALNNDGFSVDVFDDKPIDGLWNTARGAQ